MTQDEFFDLINQKGIEAIQDGYVSTEDVEWDEDLKIAVKNYEDAWGALEAELDRLWEHGPACNY